MDPRIQKDLEKADISPFHNQLLTTCTQLMKMSREGMGEYYDEWDANDALYRATVVADREDKRAKEKKEPGKMSVPLLYSQVQTYIAFIFSLYFQRKTFFELSGNNMNGQLAAKVAEALLDRDLSKSVWSGKLYQFLLDTARFGIGVIKHSWVRETERIQKTTQIAPIQILGITVKAGGTSTQMVEETSFLGNRLYSISPYRFYPDTRLPLTRFQEGEFCGSEDEFTYSNLKQLQKDGVYAGVEHIPVMTKGVLDERGPTRTSSFTTADGKALELGKHSSTILVTEVQVSLIPSEYEIDGKPMGEEDYPVKYLVAYANDQRVIRCEPLSYLHNQYTYDIGLFSPDQHKLVAECLAEMVGQLQDVINWFVNSHISSVRKTITNQFVVDPSAIDLKELDNRSPYIKLKATAARSGVDKWIKQLDVRDVTGGHVTDAAALHSFMQTVSGISENMMGQFHGGRRSAREAGNVSAGSSNRLILIAKLLFDTALDPMARKLLKNLRDGLDEATFVKLMGPIPDGLAAYNGFVKVDKKMLIGEFDFEVFDGTLASQKSLLGDVLQEVLVALMSNPEAIPIFKLDPNKIFREMLSLKGIKNLERFDLNLGSPPVPPDGTEQPPSAAPESGAGLVRPEPQAGLGLSNLITSGPSEVLS